MYKHGILLRYMKEKQVTEWCVQDDIRNIFKPQNYP